jgi:CRISPR-associated endonuclease/helicase Cas3
MDSLMSEVPAYFRYWGKAKRDSEQPGPDYHLLAYHSLDVGAVGFYLLDPKKELCQRLASRLSVSAEWLQRFFSFCLMMHDLGKFARAFQGLAPNMSVDLVEADLSRVYKIRHDALGLGLWNKVLKNKLVDLLSKQECKSLDFWIEIVCGHHGQPLNNSNARKAWRSHSRAEDEVAAEDFIRAIIAEYTPDLQPLLGIDQNILKQMSWQLAGVAVLSDWLGSDQQHFKYCNKLIPLDQYWQDTALPKARDALTSAAFLTKSIRPFYSIKDQFDFIDSPTPLQSYAQKVSLVSEPQLFILEDVTGAGKTEAAMVLVHRLMAQGLAQGLYVGLPTMATANAMYERLSKSYQSLYGDNQLPSIVLAHGASKQSEAFQQSIQLSEQLADMQYQPDDVSASAYCNQWLADSRKKALLSDVGVGTIDQALLGVLPARHQSLRLLGLADKVLLVDEVHAFDPYMQRLLEALIQAHAAQGGSVILLSATLPFNSRQTLVQAFQQGLNLNVNEHNLLSIQEKDLYPLVTHVGQNHLQEQAINTRQSVYRTVKVHRLSNEDDAIEKIQAAVKQGQCVCWIRNTVKDARESYQSLLDKDWIAADRLTLFHSRYAMIDRQTIEQDVLARFGKRSGAAERQGQVLIATQVVEQSLDLDFDVMISDLAPIDLLIQRAGRLQRHIRDKNGNLLEGKQGNEQRCAPCLYVLSPNPEQVNSPAWLKDTLPGTSYVYPEIGQLWRTIRQLQQKGGFTMPDDARGLIESVYGLDAVEIPAYLEHASNEAFAEQKVKRSMGEFNLLHLHKGYHHNSASHNGGWDEGIRIPTRLGSDTVDVVLVKEVKGKFCPYVDSGLYRWALSQIKIPQKEWEKASKLIPTQWQEKIEALKDEVPAMKWLEVWPWVDDMQFFYDAKGGWVFKKEEV